MATKAALVLKLHREFQQLETVRNGIIITKGKVVIGQNITQEGYVIMDLIHRWIDRELPIIKERKERLIKSAV